MLVAACNVLLKQLSIIDHIERIQLSIDIIYPFN